MEPKARYVLVGIFVILFSIAGVVIVLWFLGPKEKNLKAKYIIPTPYSVAGLHVDSPVKYNGLDVGRVSKIEIYRQNPRYILIYIELSRKLSSVEDMEAKISSNGLTGIAYVNLFYKKHKTKNRLNGLKYPQIDAAPSTIQSITQQLPPLINSLKIAVDKINRLLNNKTIKDVHSSIFRLNKLLGNLNSDAVELAKLLKSSRDVMPQLKVTLKKIDNLSATSNRMLNKINRDELPAVYDLIQSLKITNQHLRGLIDEINHNPQILIRGRSQ